MRVLIDCWFSTLTIHKYVKLLSCYFTLLNTKYCEYKPIKNILIKCSFYCKSVKKKDVFIYVCIDLLKNHDENVVLLASDVGPSVFKESQ